MCFGAPLGNCPVGPLAIGIATDICRYRSVRRLQAPRSDAPLFQRLSQCVTSTRGRREAVRRLGRNQHPDLPPRWFPYGRRICSSRLEPVPTPYAETTDDESREPIATISEPTGKRAHVPSRKNTRHGAPPSCTWPDDTELVVPLTRWAPRLAKSPKPVAGWREQTKTPMPKAVET